MVKKVIRRAANAMGYDVHKLSTDEWRWSYHVEDFYPVDPKARWGYGKPPHQRISEVLAKQRTEYAELLVAFSNHVDVMASVPMEGNIDAGIPHWRNGWFENLDPISLIGMLLTKRPQKYFEIGSGNSTKFARHTIASARLETKLLSLDPEPRASIDSLCDSLFRARLEDSDLTIFDDL